MARVNHRDRTAQDIAATAGRDFRTFLLMAQLEARAIGARIAQARNELGLTQEQLAEMASFSKRSLQDYESGVTIPYRNLRELGQLLGKPTEWFLYGELPGGAAPSDALADLRLAIDALDRKFDLLNIEARLAALEELIRERFPTRV